MESTQLIENAIAAYHPALPKHSNGLIAVESRHIPDAGATCDRTTIADLILRR
jgi:hypothetical protein